MNAGMLPASTVHEIFFGKISAMSIRKFAMSAMAAAICVNATAFAAEKAEQATHDGKVVRITDSALIMSSKDGEEHAMTLADDTKLTLDGKACEAKDLKAGMKIRVSTQAGDATVASKIEAIKKNATFSNTHDGKFVSMSGATFIMTGQDGKEHTHNLAADAKVTCDGKPCKISDLSAGMKIRVTTRQSDKNAATEIEALDKNAEFV
jgi:hypothetical protein